MSAPSKASRFPDHFITLAAYIQDNKEPLEMNFETEAQARRFRRDLYAYRATAEKDADFIAQYPRFQAMEIKLNENKLIIQCKNDTDEWNKVRDAVKAKGGWVFGE